MLFSVYISVPNWSNFQVVMNDDRTANFHLGKQSLHRRICRTLHFFKFAIQRGWGFNMYLRALRYLSKRNLGWQSNYIQARWSSTKTSLPLRILFCGSDDLSATCLQALHKEQQSDPAGIKSIDVLIRPAKPYGRSLKQVREGTHVFLPILCFG